MRDFDPINLLNLQKKKLLRIVPIFDSYLDLKKEDFAFMCFECIQIYMQRFYIYNMFSCIKSILDAVLV